jgi:hypothetical protein
MTSDLQERQLASHLTSWGLSKEKTPHEARGKQAASSAICDQRATEGNR